MKIPINQLAAALTAMVEQVNAHALEMRRRGLIVEMPAEIDVQVELITGLNAIERNTSEVSDDPGRTVETVETKEPTVQSSGGQKSVATRTLFKKESVTTPETRETTGTNRGNGTFETAFGSNVPEWKPANTPITTEETSYDYIISI